MGKTYQRGVSGIVYDVRYYSRITGPKLMAVIYVGEYPGL